MKILDWWHRHFTRLGRDLAWRERFAKRRGYAYPGHVPPRPMPGPGVEPDRPWPRVPRPSEWPDPPPMPSLGRPMSPISLAERAARFLRGMEVVYSLSPESLLQLKEDGRILSEAASRAKPEPPAPTRPRHHGMAIVAVESIPCGQMITLNACADGTYYARARRLGQ